MRMAAPVDQLISAGLRKELIDFYKKIQADIPASDIPAPMLTYLGS
jgi:hypothetical protein